MELESHQASFEELYSGHPLMRAIREADFDEHGLAYKTPLHHEFWWRKFENIYSLLKPANEDRLINIGVGFGFDEKVIRERLPEIELFGIDISKSMIQGALLNNTPAQVAVAASEELPFPNHAFTRVLSREVIEHVLDTRMYLQQMKAVTTKGAIIVITTPNGDSLALPHLIGRLRVEAIFLTSQVYKDDHMSTSEMESLFKECGFVIQERFFDSGGFFWLSELARTPLRFLAVPLAKITRGLDGNGWLSRLFCDQVKYALVNPDGPDKPVEQVSWVDPASKQPLTQSGAVMATDSGEVQYPLMDQKAPVFLDADESQVSSTFTPAMIRRREMLRPFRRSAYAILIIIYSIIYAPVLTLMGLIALVMNALGRKHKPA